MREIYIASRELRAILLNHQQEKWQKEAMVWMKTVSFMCDLLIFSSRSFSYEFGNLLNYFWGNDLSFFSLLIKLFGHVNLTILRISSHFKRKFFVNTKNVVVLSVVLCGTNETSEFPLGGGSRSSILFLEGVKYRAEISLKIAKIG